METDDLDDPARTQFVSKGELITMENTFAEMANSNKNFRRLPRKKVDKQKILLAMEEAFDLIGGVTRLADWAHNNPTEFYKLYGKTIPAATSLELSGKVAIGLIKPALRPSALDGEFTEAQFTEVEKKVG